MPSALKHLATALDAVTVQVKEPAVVGVPVMWPVESSVSPVGNAPADTPHLHFQAMRIKPGQHDWWNGTPVDVRQFMIRPGKALK